METYYYIYKITNKINGKLYIGVHKTNDLNDGYMGSGKTLKRAIKKHGIENFEKDILEVFNSQEEMYLREVELVNEDFVSRKDTYNMKVGGSGGWGYINSTRTSEELKRISNLSSRMCGKRHSDLTKKAMSNYRKGKPSPCSFSGMKHKEESKEKIGLANKKQTGHKNSQYGTMWITNGIENRKIKKDQPIESGWWKGRI